MEVSVNPSSTFETPAVVSSLQPTATATFQREIRPKRYRSSPREYAVRYGQLIQRDGEICAICKRGPSQGIKLEIDHTDGQIDTWVLERQRLLCKPCNVRLQFRTAPSVKERERRDPWLEPQPETETQIRRARFPQFKRACLRRLLEDKSIFPWTEAQFTISQKVGIASTTADKWIKELSQPYNLNGPLTARWENPEKGGRYRVLDLAENYLEAGPEI